jgi:hypothetical protein
LPIANGGTGSSTQNFVDLTTTQTIGGFKTFSNTIKLDNGTSNAFLFESGTTGFYTTLKAAAGLTTDIIVTLPSATGTLALTSAIPANPVGGTGTTNTLPKFTGASTIGDSAITDNGTTVTLVSRALSGTSATFSGLVTGQTTSNGNITQNFLAYNSGTSIAGASYDFQSGGTAQTARISANYEASSPDRMAMRFLVGQGSGLVEILKLFNSTMTVTGAATFSSSVNLGSIANGADISLLNIKQSSTSYNNGIYIERGGERNGYFMYIGGGSDALTFRRNYFGTQSDVMSLTRDGNVGIGTTLTGFNAAGLPLVVGSGSGNTGMTIFSGATSFGSIHFADAETTGNASFSGYINYDHSGNSMQFGTTNTERMRITSGGDVLVGTTTTDVNTVGAQLRAIGLGIFVRSGGSCLQLNRTTSDGTIASFRTSDVERGSISISGATTSYNTSSDYRLKEDFKEVKGLEKVQAIKVYDYKWKANESRMDGVKAHELAEILPYAVFGHKDEVDEDGNDKMQGVDYSKIVPIMIKAIQEQQAQIEELKALIK